MNKKKQLLLALLCSTSLTAFAAAPDDHQKDQRESAEWSFAAWFAAMPVMPAMPEMPAMPAMPEMPGIPAMPVMPAMPTFYYDAYTANAHAAAMLSTCLSYFPFKHTSISAPTSCVSALTTQCAHVDALNKQKNELTLALINITALHSTEVESQAAQVAELKEKIETIKQRDRAILSTAREGGNKLAALDDGEAMAPDAVEKWTKNATRENRRSLKIDAKAIRAFHQKHSELLSADDLNGLPSSDDEAK